MQHLRIETLIQAGPFATSERYRLIIRDILSAIGSVKWPMGSTEFTLNPTCKMNGVKPIKKNCMDYLYGQGWRHEARLMILSDAKPGPVDAVKDLPGGKPFVLEWETGNISSSHRALNKIAVGLLDGCIIGGCLIVPSRNMYKYLTDRVGNYQEIEPYFPMWRHLRIREGIIIVVEVEHDALSSDVPYIPKGTDGRALR